MSSLEMLIKEMIKLFQEAIPLEKEKLDAAASKRVTFVEECMKREQVLLLKVRGLEQKRQKIVKELGYEGKTFREIIDLETQENQKVLRPLYDELAEAIREFSSVNEEAMKIIRLNVYELDQIVKDKSQTQNAERHMTDQRV